MKEKADKKKKTFKRTDYIHSIQTQIYTGTCEQQNIRSITGNTKIFIRKMLTVSQCNIFVNNCVVNLHICLEPNATNVENQQRLTMPIMHTAWNTHAFVVLSSECTSPLRLSSLLHTSVCFCPKISVREEHSLDMPKCYKVTSWENILLLL